MRTTVAIDDRVFAAAKATAGRYGYTLGQLIERALRRELAEPDQHTPPPVPVFRGGTGQREGVNLRSNRALAELLDAPESPPSP